MRRHPIRWAVCSAALAGSFAASAPLPARAAPFFMGLGDLPGGPNFSVAYGVSGDGLVAFGESGSANTASNGLGEAFRWTLDGGMVGIGDLAGGAFGSFALSASRDGSTLVGGGRRAVGNPTFDTGREAARWTEAGGVSDLGALPWECCAQYVAQAESLTADGAVAVGWVTAGPGARAFAWSSQTGAVDLGDLAGGAVGSRAMGVSDDGTVVVGVSQSGNGSEAFRWTAQGGMAGLGDLAGGSFDSFAADISADGSVIVGRARTEAGAVAFRWTEGTGMVDLGDLAGGIVRAEATAVSADGSVIVGYGNASFSLPNDPNTAFIWDAANGMRSLQTVLVDDYGFDLTGWNLIDAYGVSDDGKVIAGRGTFQGVERGWVASLRQPGDTEDDPVLPTATLPTPTGQTFLFGDPVPGLWYDPPFLLGFDYELDGGYFTEVGTPCGDEFDGLAFSVVVGGVTVATLGGGDACGTYAFSGLDVFAFSLLGLGTDTAAPGFDAALALPTFLDFEVTDQSIFELRMSAILDDDVATPEPAALGLLLAGVAGLGFVRRRRASAR